MRDTIEMAQEAQISDTTIEFYQQELKAFEALVRADERGSKPHSLGPGEMELSLRREHNGELFEYRHRFSAEQVMQSPPGPLPVPLRSMQRNHIHLFEGETSMSKRSNNT